MDKNHVAAINIALLLIVFFLHLVVLNNLVEEIPFKEQTARLEYPKIIVEIYWEPPMSGIAAGSSMYDLTLIGFIIAIILNIAFILIPTKRKPNQ